MEKKYAKSRRIMKQHEIEEKHAREFPELLERQAQERKDFEAYLIRNLQVLRPLAFILVHIGFVICGPCHFLSFSFNTFQLYV